MSSGAGMGLSRGHEMPSSVLSSHGMLNMCNYWVCGDLSMIRWMIMKHALFVVVDMMW